MVVEVETDVMQFLVHILYEHQRWSTMEECADKAIPSR